MAVALVRMRSLSRVLPEITSCTGEGRHDASGRGEAAKGSSAASAAAVHLVLQVVEGQFRPEHRRTNQAGRGGPRPDRSRSTGATGDPGRRILRRECRRTVRLPRGRGRRSESETGRARRRGSRTRIRMRCPRSSSLWRNRPDPPRAAGADLPGRSDRPLSDLRLSQGLPNLGTEDWAGLSAAKQASQAHSGSEVGSMSAA